MSFMLYLWAFVKKPAVAISMVFGLLFAGIMFASPSAHANPTPATTTSASTLTSPVVGPVTYDCKTQSLGFSIAYPNGHVTVSWATPDGGGISAGFAVGKTVRFDEPMVLKDGQYTLGVTEYPTVGAPGVNFDQKFTVACTEPTATATVTTSKPTCVTLTDGNIKDYGTLTGDQKTYETITLKGKPSDYCGDYAFSGVGYDISNPSDIWHPAQVVAVVSSKVVGKSGLTATATVPATTCGQNDWYTGSGPKVGDKLPGAGQGYEATHKFLSQIFGGPNTWYQNVTKCEVATSTPSATESTSASTKPTESESTSTKPTATASVSTATTSASSPVSTGVAVAVATCSAGQIMSNGQCVVPGVPDTGQTGTPLMSSIGTVAPLGAAAAVLGLVGFFLYRKTRVV